VGNLTQFGRRAGDFQFRVCGSYDDQSSSTPRNASSHWHMSHHGNSIAVFRQPLSFCFMASERTPIT
jgi:hypothetical protein